MGLSAWPRSRWVAELARFWNADDRVIERYGRLLAELFSYEQIRLDEPKLEPLLVHKETTSEERKRFNTILCKIHELLGDAPLGMDAFQLTSALQKKSSISPAFSIDEIPTVIGLCSTAEVFDGDFTGYGLNTSETVQIRRFGFLQSTALPCITETYCGR